jgi:hypothetical protein
MQCAGKEAVVLLDSGAVNSVVGQIYLETLCPDWQVYICWHKIGKFHSASGNLKPLGTVRVHLSLHHVYLVVDFVVMGNITMNYFILGNDYLQKYKISLLNGKERRFSIDKETFSFDESINSVQQSVPVLPTFKDEVLGDSKISPLLELTQRDELVDCLFKYQLAFATADQEFGSVIGHEVSITLTIEKPYPPALKKPVYPASPRSRVAIEEHISTLISLSLIRKVGSNKGVDITTPVIIAWHNGKSRLVGNFWALNLYITRDRYPMPKIAESLTKLLGAEFITCMDVLKGFHQNFVQEDSRKFLLIISHLGIHKYLRMPFGIKNAPSHFQQMMDQVFREELSKLWVIIYIDYIIVLSDSWQDHLIKLRRILQKLQGINMKVSLSKCSFEFLELKALGHVVTGLTLGVD